MDDNTHAKLNNFDFPKIFAVLVSFIEEQEQVEIKYTLEKIDKTENV